MALGHRRHHGALGFAADRSLRMLLAWGSCNQRQGPNSEKNEEQCGDDFGEESHAGVLRMPALLCLVCDLNHKPEHFLTHLTLLSCTQRAIVQVFRFFL
jgi:hypothetical protein